MLSALEAGAVDVVIDGDVIEIHTDPSDFMTVKGIWRRKALSFSGRRLVSYPRTPWLSQRVQGDRGKTD